jgi:hypothetical protein
VQQPQAGLEINTAVPWWLFTAKIFPAKMSIDGSAPIPASWSTNLVPVTPGRHTVKFWWLAYWFLPSNSAELVVDVPAGQVVQLVYKPRWLIFIAGVLQAIGVRGMVNQAGAAATAQAAGWHPDPAGRHEMRYWNGSGWTDDVSDAGVAAKDPAG